MTIINLDSKINLFALIEEENGEILYQGSHENCLEHQEELIRKQEDDMYRDFLNWTNEFN